MNGWSHLFSLKSSMTQSPIMKLGAIGLGKTNASGVSGISGPVGIGTGSAFAPIVLDGSPPPALYPTVGQVPPLAHCWQGEKYELNLHVESNIAACVTVDTPGLCKSGSRYRLNDDCNTWLYSLAEGSSYEGKSIPAFGPVRADCTGVDVNVIGGRHYGRTYDVHPDIWWGQAPASLDYTQIVNTAFSSASTLTHHPWFDDSMQIIELPAGAEYADGLAVLNNAAPPPHLIRQRRAGDTPSPWVAGETSAPRLVEVKYNSSDLGPAVDAIQAAVEREGEAFVKGLHSNEAFLKVQMYN
uniref:Uncharacterized protein n=1 Tax=viral metagenome TaxID=1070528 RepID=A0A2V0RA34_9ZZZZ